MDWRVLRRGACLGLGILINETTGEFPQKEQELFEGIVAVIAVVILTWMVFWMRKVSRSVKVQLEQAVDNALQKGNHHGWALIMMVFFAVAREGLESVFFLLAAFQQDVGIWPPLGAVLGLATAVVLGFLLYWGGIRQPQGRSSNGPACLFCWSPREEGWRLGRSAPFMKQACGTTSRTWRLISAMYPLHALSDRHSARRYLPGYQETPSVSEVAMYFIYLVPALVLLRCRRVPAHR